MTNIKNWGYLLLLALFVSACGNSARTEATEEEAAEETTTEQEAPPAHNTLTAEEEAAGWQLLFDGKTIEGWHNYGKETIGSSWVIEDEALHLTAEKDEEGIYRTSDGGDIVSANTFENFEFQLEWKLTDCGNSGIMYLVQESDQYNEPWKTGPEMQILDAVCHPDGKIETHRASDLYDLIAADPVTVKPAGEWNQVRIIINNGRLEHWLNGEKVVETALWTDEWNAMVAGSKFGPEGSDYAPDFGTYRSGHIALQDHNDAMVWFRNIKIREL